MWGFDPNPSEICTSYQPVAESLDASSSMTIAEPFQVDRDEFFIELVAAVMFQPNRSAIPPAVISVCTRPAALSITRGVQDRAIG
jgi:hypothetical protein